MSGKPRKSLENFWRPIGQVAGCGRRERKGEFLVFLARVGFGFGDQKEGKSFGAQTLALSQGNFLALTFSIELSIWNYLYFKLKFVRA